MQSVQTRQHRTPPAPPPRPRAAGRLRGAWRPRVWGPYLMVAPTVAGAAFLLFYPLLRNLLISFQHFRFGELIRGHATWVGLHNYRAVLSEGDFWTVVRRTFLFTALNVVLIMVLSTLVALMLTRLGKRMRLAVMSALVLTWAMPIIAATTVFQWLFASRYGVVNWLLTRLGMDGYSEYPWFAHGWATFSVLVILIVWQSVPFGALTLYAALTTVPGEVLESARIDGAGPTRIFRSILFPMLRPIFGLVTSLEVIWVFKAFAQIWAISRGGPDGATTTLPVYAYQVAQSLRQYDLGAAISMLTVLILTVVLIAYFRQVYRQEAQT
ncbi:sugar ABC transporter permease [Actinomadura barringtoniae]|uniref:Sugar ABC transporter permease n=1 Tax=Actinomadura barringtoniae TaxID=1427535 RepID=A0A939PFI1_9ACTN|nr:sugar ABC transporter permease [Actinomadura barringtoniae]MBO2448249.1 sugar ABC transporter permease [Actinomadura barringtoniae]